MSPSLVSGVFLSVLQKSVTILPRRGREVPLQGRFVGVVGSRGWFFFLSRSVCIALGVRPWAFVSQMGSDGVLGWKTGGARWKETLIGKLYG